MRRRSSKKGISKDDRFNMDIPMQNTVKARHEEFGYKGNPDERDSFSGNKIACLLNQGNGVLD